MIEIFMLYLDILSQINFFQLVRYSSFGERRRIIFPHNQKPAKEAVRKYGRTLMLPTEI